MEPINLEKGNRVDLTKTIPGLKHVGIGLGWDVKKGNDADLDAFAVALRGGKFTSNSDLIYFGHLEGVSGSIKHSGDNLTGAGDGDDEVINIDLSKVPADVDQIMVAVNIYQAESRRQNFGQIDNAFIRVFDQDTNQEICRYDLSEDYSSATGMVMGKVYLHNGEWKFQAVGEGKNGSIADIVKGWE